MMSTSTSRLHRLPALALLVAPLLAIGATPLAAKIQVPTVDAPEVEAPPAKPDQLERARKRIVHLSNGTSLRGKSRLNGEQWEVELGKQSRGQQTIAVPASMVVRVVEERALLADARRRAARVKRDDHAARILHARWLLSEGLSIECLESVDRVLESEPDFVAALEFLGERPVKIGLPDPSNNLPEYLRVASRTSPSARELAIEQLKIFEDRIVLRAQLNQQLVSERDTEREFALLALRRLYPGESINGIVRRAILDRSTEVRKYAALALRDAKNPQVAEPVIGVLGSKHSVLRKHAAVALGFMNYATAVKPLIASLAARSSSGVPGSNIFVGTQTAYVQDFDVEVAQNQSIANPRVNVLVEGVVLDARVISTTTVQVSTERRVIRSSLSRITGAKVNSTQSAWQKWWDSEGEAWLKARETAKR